MGQRPKNARIPSLFWARTIDFPINLENCSAGRSCNFHNSIFCLKNKNHSFSRNRTKINYFSRNFSCICPLFCGFNWKSYCSRKYCSAGRSCIFRQRGNAHFWAFAQKYRVYPRFLGLLVLKPYHFRNIVPPGGSCKFLKQELLSQKYFARCFSRNCTFSCSFSRNSHLGHNWPKCTHYVCT